MRQPRAPVLHIVGRGLTRRCPRCGAGHLFRRWFKMIDRCPRCGHHFAREEGFFLGAYVINFGVTVAGLGVIMGILIAVLANAGSSRAIAVTALAAVLEALLVPMVFYPFSKTLWAAIDLAMHRSETWAGATVKEAPATTVTEAPATTVAEAPATTVADGRPAAGAEGSEGAEAAPGAGALPAAGASRDAVT